MFYIKDIFNNKKIGLFNTEGQVLRYIHKHQENFISWGVMFKIYWTWPKKDIEEYGWKHDIDMTGFTYLSYKKKYGRSW